MTKKRKLLIIFAAAVVFIVVLITLNIVYKTKKCAETRLDPSLSGKQTVEQLFRYWNDGNRKGEQLIYDCYLRESLYDSDKPYCFWGDVINTKITEISRCKELEKESTELGKEYSEYEIYRVCWENKDRVSPIWVFADQDLNLRYNNFSFLVVARKSPNEPFKIVQHFTGP